MLRLNIFFLIAYLLLSTYTHAAVSGIVFSFDRPMQLHAYYDSLREYVKNIDELYIIYRASTHEFEDAYNTCFSRMSSIPVHIYKQGLDPQGDFKTLTQQAVNACKNNYIFFAVDDLIVKDYFDVDECVSLLQQTNSYGFYLRLGLNITHSYAIGLTGRSNPVPSMSKITDNVFSWTFASGMGEWCYPHTVDMTLYKKQDILSDISDIIYTSPNTFEWQWHERASHKIINTRNGLCYQESKVCNIPFNLTQTDWTTSRNMGYSKEYFLSLYNAGYIIDIKKYYKTTNTAPHCQLPLFIKKFDKRPV